MPIPLLDSEGLFGIIANYQLCLQTFGYLNSIFKSADPSQESMTFRHRLKNVVTRNRADYCGNKTVKFCKVIPRVRVANLNFCEHGH